MATTTDIEKRRGSPLTGIERERIYEITGYSRSIMDPLIDALDQWKRMIVRDVIADYDALGPGNFQLKGGKDGVYLSKPDDRQDIRNRMRALFELPETNSREQRAARSGYTSNVPVW